MMENAEEILQFLEEFTKRKPKTIPQELNDYLAFVARTGDPVYQWPLIKSLFKEKLLNVITEFYETSPGIDIPPYPNVDPFNYDIMKNSLLERLDSFHAAPFTVQRICELLTFPRKQYNRIDKFMRAVEKNILVVSTREPGPQRHVELENGDPLEPIVNGSDNNSEYNVDVEMEDMSWKENADQTNEPQPSSSDAHISVDDIETRLHIKKDSTIKEIPDKPTIQYESVTPPETSIPDENLIGVKEHEKVDETAISNNEDADKVEVPSTSTSTDLNMDTENTKPIEAQLVIPKITVDDAEMTEQKLIKQASIESEDVKQIDKVIEEEEIKTEPAVEIHEVPQQPIDENSSDSNKEDAYAKIICEVSTSSEESSSSSDITDGNSNSPKPEDTGNAIALEVKSEQSDVVKNTDAAGDSKAEITEVKCEEIKEETETVVPPLVESEDYSVSDVKSELKQTEEFKEVSEKIVENDVAPTDSKIEDSLQPEITKESE